MLPIQKLLKWNDVSSELPFLFPTLLFQFHVRGSLPHVVTQILGHLQGAIPLVLALPVVIVRIGQVLLETKSAIAPADEYITDNKTYISSYILR